MREPDESESAYIKRSFKEAVDEEGLDRIEDGLKEEGLKIENIRPRKSERRQELRKQQKALVVKGAGGALTAEAIAELLPSPTDVDGRVDGVFVAGMKYEALNIIRGIRMAQELSKMGIDQATPVIRMAQEMRATEGKAADEAAMKAAAGVGAQIMPVVEALKNQMIASSPNPMMSMFAQTMQPLLGQVMGNMMTMFQPKTGQLQLGAQVGQPGQPGAQQPVGPQASEEEVKEAFE